VGAATGLDGYGSEAEGASLGGGLGRRSLLFPFHAVEALDHQEHGKGYDDKADDGVDEGPQVEGHGPSGFGCGQGGKGPAALLPSFNKRKRLEKSTFPRSRPIGGMGRRPQKT